MDTKTIRTDLLARRRQLDDEFVREQSNLIADQLFETEEYKYSSVICIYINFNQEVMTDKIIEHGLQQGKRLAAPRIINNYMEFIYFSHVDEFTTGKYGIQEPTGEEIVIPNEHTLILMPGVAFDEDRHRIGYGGGFYDRYLQAHSNCSTIALAFDFQLIEHIDSEEFDIKPQKIITHRRTII